VIFIEIGRDLYHKSTHPGKGKRGAIAATSFISKLHQFSAGLNTLNQQPKR